MSRFIELHLDNTNQKVIVNSDKIVKFSKTDNHTVVELDGGVSMTVKETLTEIWDMIIMFEV